jgi:hypothetical protein
VLDSWTRLTALSMLLTLVVPGLLDLPASVLVSVDPHAPALSRLLASAAPAQREEDGLVATACRACGIARQVDWPVAPSLARAAMIDPKQSYWLCAEPATMAVGADDVRLDALVDDLTLEDAGALIATLNAHFAADDLDFIAATPAHWLARVPTEQRLSTRPPEAAIGGPLLAYLPSGPDAARWRRWQNELQMLLFEHPVNRQREQADKAPVNSVWLWGGGTEAHRQPAVRVFADDSRVRDLARGSAIDPAPPPAGLQALETTESAAVWLAAIDADCAGAKLGAIEREWMQPIESAVRGARLSVELVLGGREHTLRFQPRRTSITERWRARFSPPLFSQLVADASATDS